VSVACGVPVLRSIVVKNLCTENIKKNYTKSMPDGLWPAVAYLNIIIWVNTSDSGVGFGSSPVLIMFPFFLLNFIFL